MLSTFLRPRSLPPILHLSRLLSTLPSNPHIYIHPNPSLSESYTLSFSTDPDSPSAIGTSTANPPTPSTFTSNPHFSKILQRTLAAHAYQDPGLKAQAVAFAAAAGGGAIAAAGGVRGAAGSAGVGKFSQGRNIQGGAAAKEETEQARPVGFMHVADERNPAAYGRIPEPEDIFGSLEVRADGGFVEGTGCYQESGTYRILTREGCLGLSDFLRGKLVERLQEGE